MPQLDRAALTSMALAYIESEGIRTLSLTTLAQRVGVSRATVYRQFQGREDLLGEIARTEMAKMVIAAEAAVDVGADTNALAASLVRFALNYLRAHRALGAVKAHGVDQLLSVVVPHAGTKTTVIELVSQTIEPVLASRAHATRLELAPRQAAEVLVRTVLSHYLSPASALSDDDVARAAARAVCR